MKCVKIPALLLAVCAVSSCGGGEKQPEPPVVEPETAQPQGPQNSVEDLSRDYVATYGSHKYDITVSRAVDHSLPLVVDMQGDSCYDNSVTLDIVRDGGESILKHVFVKKDFDRFLDEGEKKGMVLLGMAFDEGRSSSSTLCFTARIGAPFVEEGPAFIIEVSTSGTWNIREVSPQELEGDVPEELQDSMA